MLASLRQRIADWRVVISFLLLAVFLLRCAGELGAEAASRTEGAAYVLFGWTAVLLGAGLRTWSAGILRKGCDLTTLRPYSLCRDPLYWGSFLMLVGVLPFAPQPPPNYGPVVPVIARRSITPIPKQKGRLRPSFQRRWAQYVRARPKVVLSPRALPAPP